MSTKPIRVMIELAPTPEVQTAFSFAAKAADATVDASVIPSFANISLDMSYGGAQVPRVFSLGSSDADTASNLFGAAAERSFSFEPQNSTYIIRGEVADEEQLQALEAEVAASDKALAVYADVEIQPQLICPGSAAVGTHLDVARLLCTSKMQSKGMNGAGVRVAIVDTGINIAYLNARGVTPITDAANSWYLPGTGVSFTAPVDHGTMCAFDVCIAAPRCTLLDIALLRSTASGFAGLLSDAVRAYSHLMTVISRPVRPGANASLVVSNSWGMFHPSWDFPVGHPGNYSSNPAHPFNRIVASLEAAGADILFAAGNCGPECPDGRCQNVTNQGIYGANSSPAVLSVAGIAVNLDRVGYSNRGPGRLTDRKPDITGYTHFRGSGVYAADGGTSAACPVVAGVVAAVRTARPLSAAASARPAAIRSLVTSSARDIGSAGWDYFYGFGLVDGCKLVDKLFPVIDICRVFPQICRLRADYQKFESFCARYPDICGRVNPRDLDRYLDRFPVQEPQPQVFETMASDSDKEDGHVQALAVSGADMEDFNFLEGFLTALEKEPAAASQNKQVKEDNRPEEKQDCGCQKK